MRAWTAGRTPTENTEEAGAAADRWPLAADGSCEPLADPTSEIARAQAMLRTFEAEIIPRLMQLHRQPHAGPAAGPAVSPGAGATSKAAPKPVPVAEADVEQFSAALLKGLEPAWERLQVVQRRGVSVVHLCVDLLSPAARRLGQWWSEDRCDFAQVTLASGWLQALLHRLTASLPTVPLPAGQALNAVFVAAPGEQHTLGLSMVRDFFRVAGWQVHGEPVNDPQALLALLQRSHVDLIGFTLGAERHVPALAALIADVRAASANRAIRVMVGGPLLLSQPDLLQTIGADATAGDASQAILAAHKLVVHEG